MKGTLTLRVKIQDPEKVKAEAAALWKRMGWGEAPDRVKDNPMWAAAELLLHGKSGARAHGFEVIEWKTDY